MRFLIRVMTTPSGCIQQVEPPGRDYAHIELTCLMNVYFDQGDTSALSCLLARYAKMPAPILDRVQFIIVDDASPTRLSIPPDLDLNLLVLRIREDIAWNQPGARNLGMVYARSDKVLVTDVDHEFNQETFNHALAARNPGRTFYKLRRIEADGSFRRPHPNTFFLSRARFLKFHGYDEAFAGHYGFDDSMLWRWQRYHGTRFLYLPKSCVVTHRSVDREDGYHSHDRDLTHNRKIAEAKKTGWKAHGPAVGHSRRFLGFTWDLVEDRVRSTPIPQPPVRRGWTQTWLWRWLWG